jgi:uncharacterized protein YdeI (YjbR/CyaY-like superfamily)
VEIGETLLVETRAQWRAWLEQYASTKREIWLITYKKGAARRSLDYDSVLDEATCFGWVDGMIKGVDDQLYVARWSPRRRRSHWTAGNLARARQMIDEGRMTAAGLAALPEGAIDTSA